MGTFHTQVNNNNVYFSVGQADGIITIFNEGCENGFNLHGHVPSERFINLASAVKEENADIAAVTSMHNTLFLNQANTDNNQNQNNQLPYNTDILRSPHGQTVWAITYHPMGYLMASGSME